MTKEELAQDYFDRHPQSNECHVTSDLRVFHQKSNAESFAANLKDSKVASFTRNHGSTSNEEQTPEQKLLAFNPEVTSYDEAKELVKLLKIKLESKTKESHFEALAAAKEYLIKNQE